MCFALLDGRNLKLVSIAKSTAPLLPMFELLGLALKHRGWDAM